VSLPYPALELLGCMVTIDELAKTVRIDPSPEWLNQFKDKLSDEDLESANEFGYIERPYCNFGGTMCGVSARTRRTTQMAATSQLPDRSSLTATIPRLREP
jgi:hypothetical protein